MSVWAWIITIILGGIIAAFLVLAAVGNIVSSQFSGRAYLRKHLSRHGITADRVPDACLDELVALADKAASFTAQAGRDKYNNAFVSMLDTMVDVVKQWIANPNDPMFKSFSGDENDYRTILEKHGVK